MPTSSDVFGVMALLSGIQVHRLGHMGLPSQPPLGLTLCSHGLRRTFGLAETKLGMY